MLGDEIPKLYSTEHKLDEILGFALKKANAPTNPMNTVYYHLP